MLHEASHWLVASWKAAVTFAGGLVVILGLIFHPPWGGSSSKASSDTTTSTAQTCPASEGFIKKLGIDPPIRLADYWVLHPLSRPPNPSKERANTLGRIVHFRLQISGFRGRKLDVWWWTLTQEGKAVRDPILQRQLAFSLTPGTSSCTAGGTRDIWTQLPDKPGKYRVKVQLMDGDEEVDSQPTKVFTVAAHRS